MSLIQEALKRQEQEIGRNSAESVERGLVPPKTTPPPVPDEEPDRPPAPAMKAAPPENKKSLRGIGVLLASLLVIVLLLGVAGYFFMIAAKTYQSGQGAAPAATAGQVQVDEPTVADDADVVTSGQPSAKMAVEPKKIVPTQEPQAAVQPPVIDATPVRASARERPSGKAAAEQRPAPAAKPVWPKLTVMGVMVKSDPRLSAAVIENNMVGIGEYVQGVRVLEIRSEGVVMQFEGETRTVSPGSSTR